MHITEELIKEYTRWCNHCKNDKNIKPELEALMDNPDELVESFYDSLSFGTSGIRGILGAGPNRMNIYVIRRVTQGLAKHILQNVSASNANVVVAYDTRKHSKKFAIETARVLSGFGIKVFLFAQITPVPILSYAISKLNASYGIMITASHNHSSYNGYKVYSKDGYQIVGTEPEEILKSIQSCDYFDDINLHDDYISFLDKSIASDFIEDVISFMPKRSCPDNSDELKIIYTPLNGTGNEYVRETLLTAGFNNVSVVPSQEMPDENFITCNSPNPEKLSVYNEGFRLLDREKADIIIATDPDADRVGCALIHDGTKINLTGNQLAILMLDFLCTVKSVGKNSMCFKSIVSTPLFNKLATANGIKTVETLTGFKYIGKHISDLIKEGNANRFFFGFEESNGFLMSPFIRDKDGISSALLIAVMADYHKKHNLDLIDRLDQIYDELGMCIDKCLSFMFEGIKGQEAMQEIMTYFRNMTTIDLNTLGITSSIDYMSDDTGLPKSNVIYFNFNDGSKVIVRPSGTEGKIKVYTYLTRRASAANAVISIIENFRNEFKENMYT